MTLETTTPTPTPSPIADRDLSLPKGILTYALGQRWKKGQRLPKRMSRERRERRERHKLTKALICEFWGREE